MPFKNSFPIIIAIFSLVIGILSLFDFGPWHTIISAVLTLSLLFIVVILSTHFVKWCRSIAGVKVFIDWNDAPKKYHVKNTLEYCTKPKAKLEIIGRTCFRWLCGDERAFREDKQSFEEQQGELQKLIIGAIEHGASIYFVLQNYTIPVAFFNAEETEDLQKHAKAAIASYYHIHSRLSDANKKHFRLSLINNAIERSMVRIAENSEITRMIFDLDFKFKSPRDSKRKGSKPFIVMESTRSSFERSCVDKFNCLLGEAIPHDIFDDERKRHLNEAYSLLSKHKHHSSLRKDNSTSLARVAARYYIAENIQDLNVEIPPPVSVQLLITNDCTTHCKMCDHHKLFRQEEELTEDELFCTLDIIKDLGTNSIIVSGGEPLSCEWLYSVLEHAKKIGLKAGLLTNGISRGGSPIDSDKAKVLSQTCSWLQMSIDSFKEETYKMIRGDNYLSIALESLRNIVDAGLAKVEICTTIQKDNIAEIMEMSAKIDDIIPSGVPLRFKFAHGPANKRDYLASKDQLVNLIRQLPCKHDRFNWDYLRSMVEDNHFNCENLSLGEPLKDKMMEYRALAYKCHALRFTCKIDANGDVYPCCFLFDDNCASSPVREVSCLGSLRSNSKRVSSPTESSENSLRKIWHESDKLNRYRETTLPVNEKACIYCTRHFYQNEYLNQLCNIFTKGKQYGIAQEIANTELDKEECNYFWV